MRRSPLLIAVLAVAVAAVLVAGAGLAIRVLAPRAAGPVAGASTSAESAEASWPKPAAISWRSCADRSLAGAECATVAVPLDWSAPRGRTITIAVSRVLHTTRTRTGVMIVNPGGPGVSGLGLAGIGRSVPNGAGQRYDWIGFDPRGVGSSRPRIVCMSTYNNGPRPLYAPPTAGTLRTWQQRAAAYASACRRNGALLDHMTTEDTAKDIEYLRLALRAPRISYYGFSYGTYLGQVYATLFPHRVQRMVLDSNVDPGRIWYGANLDQDAAFQTTMDRFFDWVARADDVYHLGTTRLAVEREYSRLAAALRTEPAGGVLGPDELSDTVLEAGYEASVWPQIGAALAVLAHQGDAAPMIEAWRATANPTDDNGYAAYLAVECTDAPWPKDWATWQRDSARVNERATFETWPNTWFNAPCLTWPGRTSRPVPVDGGAAPAALLIDETLDAATPYSGSLEVRARFPLARLLAEPGGTSHADSLSGNVCVDTAVARYLADGTLPARRTGRTADATCAPLPQPSPG